ncbi:cellulose biosynthesis protein BcsF [Edwardsiella hoshinae]|uniref:Celllulose biosynthesis operon protein BcsF/YhjT n=1 Tax=Edwardsiella hoshinae TaxID=93378 RepID=A0A376D5E9_9GAMM|nr:cellulose biosynthesis protein BcsF [Edwardsiella hoshinae]QPR28587.1 cellulose biosynthesis protein BcsF [Edwardsiella hoshinae]STC82723.1 celllulose biosynthesis operon protein BcsF/YhjT [Edwardsiella hoshinae]
MITITDILQLIALCALVMLPAGFYLHRCCPHPLRALRRRLFPTRYLKPVTVLHRRPLSATVDKHDKTH